MSYTQQVSILSDSEKIFNAITQHIPKWWGNTDSPVSKVGDEFITSFDKTYWKFRIAELIPGKKIIWECIEAKHIHNGYDNIEKEWLGTFVNWTIDHVSEKESKLLFSHDGLTSDLNCYEICTPAWDRFVTQSLKSFVETGKGMPHLS
ncbi:hypothetical protein BKI52_31765 [marine bacterium AO1-C]|nr:hypothetical protein BKI52_31765 [marine bacterium AO1-C]